MVQSIETLIKSIHKPSIHIQYKRAVTIDGNGVAQKVIQKVLNPVTFPGGVLILLKIPDLL